MDLTILIFRTAQVMRNGIKQSDVMADMPDAMITQVLMYLYAQDVKKVPMFSGLDESFIKQLVVHLDDCVCLKVYYHLDINVTQLAFFAFPFCFIGSAISIFFVEAQYLSIVLLPVNFLCD